MDQGFAEASIAPNHPRATSQRHIGTGTGAGAESESRRAPGAGPRGADALLDPLRLNDAMRRLGSRLAADPSPEDRHFKAPIHARREVSNGLARMV